jgi:chromosome segregation ATPase
MSPQKDMSSGAQKLADGLNNRSAQQTKNNPAKVIEEMGDHIKAISKEISKTKREVVELQDLISYHRDRISALESENRSITLELKEKSIKLNETSDLLELAKKEKKIPKKTKVYKKTSKNNDIDGSAGDPQKTAPKPVAYKKHEKELDI